MSVRTFVAAALLSLASFPAVAEPRPLQGESPAAADAAKCEHGVKKTLCTRCNPRLAPVFKAKGDWCAEHQRPESQCVPCHPELAKRGIK
jgi:hypothetical protein